jgi:Flp pilus assembly pilin Flp
MQFIKNFIREQEGQDIVEYGLVLGLVALAGAGVLAALGGDVTRIMDAVQALFDAVPTPA